MSTDFAYFETNILIFLSALIYYHSICPKNGTVITKVTKGLVFGTPLAP